MTRDVPFPLPRPIRNRAESACARFFDVPQSMKQNMTLIKPMRMTGFRPILSESRPQGTANMLCDTEKAEPTMPAHLATLFSGMPKLLIISGRYGKTEVSANGSANLTIARKQSC